MSTMELEMEKKPDQALPEQKSGEPAVAQQPAADKSPEQQTESKAPIPKKTGAIRAFHLTNFVGFHMLFNSTTSVMIAYYLLTTDFAKKLKNGLGDSFVGKASYYIFNAPAKAINAGMKLFSKNYREKLKSQPALTEAEKLVSRQHSARSAVETAFMCIAGFLALAPVKWLEDHRAWFLNSVDNLLHPGRSPEEKERVALKQEDMHKETWTNLLRARFVALAAVFSVDAIQQNINNMLGYDKGKENLDTLAWKFGANLYDNMDSGLRTKIVNFFGRKKVNLLGLQTDMRSHLLKAIDSPAILQAHNNKDINPLQQLINKTPDKAAQKVLEERLLKAKAIFSKAHPEMTPHVQRAVFAEQSRLLFTKELWLTTVMSIVIYTAAKAPFMARFFEKIGLKHKTGENSADDEMQILPDGVPLPLDGVTNSVASSRDSTSWSSKVGTAKSEKTAAATSFTDSLQQQSSNPETAISV